MLPQPLLQVWGEASYALLVVAVGVLPTTSPAHPRAQWRLRELSKKTG